MFEFDVIVRCPYCKSYMDTQVSYDGNMSRVISKERCDSCGETFAIYPSMEVDAETMTMREHKSYQERKLKEANET